MLTALVREVPAATDIQGVRVEDSVDVQGHKLLLNGAGIRYKGPFKVGVVALYLERHATSFEDVMATPGAKRLHMILLRDMDSEELGRAFTRGVEDNLERANRASLVPSLLRMGQIFSMHKRLMQGDTLVMDWIPGRGTQIMLRGTSVGEPFREPEFFKALMANQIGATPVDFRLKELLLAPAPSSSHP